MKKILLTLFLLMSVQIAHSKDFRTYRDYWKPIKVDTKEQFIYIYYFLNNYYLTIGNPKSYDELGLLRHKCNELGRALTLLDFVELNKNIAPHNYLNTEKHVSYVKLLEADTKDKCITIY